MKSTVFTSFKTGRCSLVRHIAVAFREFEMAMFERSRDFRQLSLGLTRRKSRLVTVEIADGEAREADYNELQDNLHSLSPVWPHALDVKACPHPLIVPQSQLLRLEKVHQLLSSAITNIVERWWSDEGACFPYRMPLEPLEEKTLKWVSSLDSEETPPYRTCQGSWRPDFLLDNRYLQGGFQICEVNSRFPFNGLLHTAFVQQAYLEMEDKSKRLARPAARPEDIIDGLFSLFDPSLPLHLLKGEETGLDIHQVIEYIASVTGKRPILIAPSDLRLVPCSHSMTGSSLNCVSGQEGNGSEKLEVIHQVGLELCQHELAGLPPTMLREIALRCFNDLRTVFLVHDKRMLGIVLEELDSLVHRHRLFSSAEADFLRQHIVPTINPGSKEMEAMLSLSKHSPHVRKDFLLKPVRGGKGQGLIFGTDTSADEWISQLELLQQAKLEAGQPTYVVQRRVEQPRFDLLLNGVAGLQHNYLVGTFIAVQGRYLGLGFWRSSSHRISALSRGGDWVCSVTAAPAVAKL
ncbi:MAG: hypothetical protein Q9210_003135 [Variospora velana]